MPSLNTRPKIKEFSDYREYLKAMYRYSKEKKRTFSYQTAARRIGASASYLKNVVEKRRQISVEKIFPVALAFGLKGSELDYFMILSLYGITKDVVMRRHLKTVLGSIGFVMDSESGPYQEQRDDAGAYVTGSRLASAILELVRFKDFLPEVQWIRERLIDGETIEASKIKETFEKLIELGLLKENNGKFYNERELNQYASPFTPKQSLAIYREAAAKTLSILSDAPAYRACRFFVGAYAVGKDEELAILEEFNHYRDRATQIARKSIDPDRVIYISNNYFNLTRNK